MLLILTCNHSTRGVVICRRSSDFFEPRKNSVQPYFLDSVKIHCSGSLGQPTGHQLPQPQNHKPRLFLKCIHLYVKYKFINTDNFKWRPKHSFSYIFTIFWLCNLEETQPFKSSSSSVRFYGGVQTRGCITATCWIGVWWRLGSYCLYSSQEKY